jgi:hypothetical protein
MGFEQRSDLEPGSQVPLNQAAGADPQQASLRQRPEWRTPVVTRLIIDRTLFNAGSPNDAGTSGASSPV